MNNRWFRDSLVYLLMAGFCVAFSDGVITDNSVDSRIPALVLSMIAALISLRAITNFQKTIVVRLLVAFFLYVVVWAGMSFSLMYLGVMFDGSEIFGVLLRNSVSNARFHFFSLLAVFSVFLLYLGVSNRKLF